MVPLLRASMRLSAARVPHTRAQVGDFGGACKILGRNAGEFAEQRGHGIVDPHFDGAPFALHPLRGSFDLSGIGHVGGDHHGFAAACLDFSTCSLQAVLTPGE